MFFGDIEVFSGYLEEKYGACAWQRLLSGRPGNMELSVTYYPGINEYQGRKSPQIVITHYK